jgi:FdrA protein
MSVLKAQLRTGVYYDSVVLMQLQHALTGLPGVLDAGVVMGTAANKELLAQSDLLAPEAQAARPDDLIVALRAENDATAQAALARVDDLLSRRRTAGASPAATGASPAATTAEQDYLPKSLSTALRMLPEAQWVMVSVPGRYAADVAREALLLGRHVFLFSDNVSIEDEVDLKRIAVERGLLVMGPDCGTAIVNGVGLGFANRVRRGAIGIVAASGTGLQQVSCRIHQLGGGITHALGTGGRDLSEAVDAVTARQALDLFRRDPETKAIVLISKPPAAAVAGQLLDVARLAGKPIVVDFIGYPTSLRQLDNLHFAGTFDEAARLAVDLAADTGYAIQNTQYAIRDAPYDTDVRRGAEHFAPGQRYLRGLFSGGTLAYEALLILQHYVPVVYSNAPLKKDQYRLHNSLVSQENTIVDLGEDEFTVGRLHPMLDNTLRIRRLEQEAADAEVAVILLDVVLGYGAHSDPAGELAPAIAQVRARMQEAGRHLEVVVVVVGTDADPQGFDRQVEQLKEAGARVETSNDQAARTVGRLVQSLTRSAVPPPEQPGPVVDVAMLKQPLAAINVGLETFAQSLREQGAQVIQVDWRPPAGGNERLMAILRRMQSQESP